MSETVTVPPFYAHSTKRSDKADWESLPDHQAAVAALAELFAAAFGLGEAARLLGLLHDLGKFDPRFQRKLEGIRQRVDHSTAGAALLMAEARRQLAAPQRQKDRITAELMAAAIAGHHAGLPDRRGGDEANLEARLATYRLDERLDPAWRTVLPLDLGPLFPPDFRPAPQSGFLPFQLGFLGRMLFSALVDADFKATERFYIERGERETDRDWPSLAACLPAFRDGFAAKIAGFGAPEGELAVLRARILAHVRAKAAMAPGLFTLNVPTGGGKTLASLGFALDHAAFHNAAAGAERFRRIITAIPFTSVTEQTAAVFREVLGEDLVLEHHSGFEAEEEKPQASSGAEADSRWATKDKMRLAMEDWAAPVVVTTHVQLFESLFASRTSRTRKLHNIANSIVILDEAQVLPLGLLGPTVRAIDELARNYGCTVVLCTATQPAFDARHFAGKAAKSPLALDLADRELAPDPSDLYRRLKRAEIRAAPEPLTDEDLVEALATHDQALVILNSRAHALTLYMLAKAKGLDGLVHLTTRQHAADRQAILADVRARLKPAGEGGGRPCRLIATSLVEAGVDFDFPVGWRAETGLDSIVQAAGRVNREGRRPLEASVLTVFRPAEAKPPAAFAGLIGDMRRVFERHPEDPAAPEAVTDYFREVYWREDKGIDAKRILSGQGTERLMDYSPGQGVDIAYRAIAERYVMIEEAMVPVVVLPEGKEAELSAMLAAPQVSSGLLARKLQPFTVQTPRKARAALIAAGHVALAAPDLRADQFPVLKSRDLYGPEIGLHWEHADYLMEGDLIV